MNQEILKDALKNSAELAKKAEEVHGAFFRKLSPECEYYKLSAGGSPFCMALFSHDAHDVYCKKETCPLLRTLTDKELEEIEAEIEENGIGHA